MRHGLTTSPPKQEVLLGSKKSHLKGETVHIDNSGFPSTKELRDLPLKGQKLDLITSPSTSKPPWGQTLTRWVRILDRDTK